MERGHCVFCAVRDGRSPAFMVDENQDVLAFLDIRPLFPGHVLVVPRIHVTELMSCSPELNTSVFAETQRIADAVKSATSSDGIFVAVNNTVSQSVPHLHVHVVPRRFKDGLRGFMWPRRKYGSDQEADEMAAAIRGSLR